MKGRYDWVPVAVALAIVAIVLAFLAAYCTRVSPDQPVAPTRTPTVEPTYTPAPTVTAYVVVPTVASTATPSPTSTLTPLPTATQARRASEFNTPAPTATKPAPPAQVPAPVQLPRRSQP
jgi:hypothetical protein